MPMSIFGITFPANKIHRDWYRIEPVPYELEISDHVITTIEPYAFSNLKTVDNLTLMDMPIETLPNDIFHGLIRLAEIRLIGLKLKTIGNGIFDDLQKLRSFYIIRSMQPTTTSINQIFNDSANALKFITIEYEQNNLADLIRKETFGNTLKVKYLRLSNNKITSIAVDTFDYLATCVKVVNLNHNLLKTLPEDIFQPFFTENQQTIELFFLFGNPWHCTCDLMWLQRLIKQKPLFAGPGRCNTPNRLHNKRMIDHNFCVNASAAPIVSVNLTFSCDIADKSVSAMFARNEQMVKIVRNPIKGVDIHVKSFPDNSILIWYENDFPRQIQTVNCLGAKGGNKLKVIAVNVALVEKKTYIFCLATKKTLNISPLDCLSYQHFD